MCQSLRRFSMDRQRAKVWLYDHRVRFGLYSQQAIFSRWTWSIRNFTTRILTYLFCPARNSANAMTSSSQHYAINSWIRQYSTETTIAKPNFHSRIRESNRDKNAEIRAEIRQIDIREYVYPRYIQEVFIWLSPRVHSTTNSRKL